MGAIRSYLLQIISSALICGILIRLIGNKGLLSESVKLLAGVYMALTVLNPWMNIRIGGLQDVIGDVSTNAEAATQEGKKAALSAMSDIIKQRSQAYILDKATSLGACITVEVRLSRDEVPYPVGVTISGAVSPYAKSILSSYITENLGISMEDQTWIA